MPLSSEDLATTAQDQLLAALQSAQSAVLEGVKLWSGAVDGLVPTDLMNSVPGLDEVPSPVTYAALRMDFAEKLLAHQREFVEKLLATADTPSPAPHVVSVVPGTTEAAEK